MSEVSQTLLRRFYSRAETIESKAIDLFLEIEAAFGEDSDEASLASGTMTAARELRGFLTPATSKGDRSEPV